MCDRCEDLEEALWRIAQWADAYPTDVFREPSREDSNLAHTVLKAHSLSIDIFSASMGRHCLKGIGDIAHNALKK